MGRALTALTWLATTALVVPALGQTTPHKKKKKKHPAPAATATVEIAPSTPPAASSASTAPPAPTPPEEEESAPGDARASEHAAPPNEPTGGSPASPVRPWSAGVLVGYGFDGAERLGFGARAGYTLPIHVYLGASFVYHLGSGSNGATTNVLYPGVEGGYELAAGPVLLRPYGGFGPVFVRASHPTTTIAGVTEGGGTSVNARFGMWLGGLVTAPIGERFFAGGDLRLVLVSGFTTAALFGTFGARF